mgnify:FL=1
MSYRPVPIEPVTPQILERDWGQETVVAETPDYTGKILLYRAGRAGGLQYHVRKDETFCLHSGEAWVDFDDGSGRLTRRPMTAGMSFRIPPGAVHRFEAITDCVVFEASTNVRDDRVRMEAWFGEPDVGGLPSTVPEPTR